MVCHNHFNYLVDSDHLAVAVEHDLGAGGRLRRCSCPVTAAQRSVWKLGGFRGCTMAQESLTC